MNKRLLIAPLLALMLCGAIFAYAISWTDPTYAFYGSAGTGPIYFEDSFEATAGFWTGGCVVFSDFNMASAGVFGTIGFAADLGVSLNVVEVIPADRIVIESTSGVGGNFTVYMPDYLPVNVTSATAWNFDSGFLEVQAPAGVTEITISFVTGGGTIFIIPEWFINQGGVFFGVADFFSNVSNVMASFVAWFTSSVSNVISLIFYVMSGIVSWATFIITWFGRGITFMLALFTAVGNVFDTASTTVAPYKEVIDLLFSADGLMLAFIIGFGTWFGSLPARAKRSGGNMFAVLTGDVQTAMWYVDLVWGWSWTVFNFVYGVVMQFVGLLWGLIP